MSSPLEIIKDGDTPVAYIVDSAWKPEATEFLTPNDFSQQMGMIVYAKGQHIIPHMHIPVERIIHGTTECVIVREGACEVDIYNAQREVIATRSLAKGAIILLLGGGHGFRMTEDTILFEVKQGPYMGDLDKERFPA